MKDFVSSGCMVDGVPTLDCVEVLFGNLLFLSGAFVLFILLIMLIYGGYNYLTSFGSEEKIKKAQGTMRYAILGLVIYVSAYLILNIIDIAFLGGCGRIFHFSIKDANTDQQQNPCPNKNP
jgi:hypothetical protein